MSDGEEVSEGKLLAEWDPYTTPFITEVGGKVQFKDLELGITLKEQVDEVTGIFKKVVIESKNLDIHPQIVISDGKKSKVQYSLPIGAISLVWNLLSILDFLTV